LRARRCAVAGLVRARPVRFSNFGRCSAPAPEAGPSANPPVEIIDELDDGASFAKLAPYALEVGMCDIALEALRW
jgi:hypothetical protein